MNMMRLLLLLPILTFLPRRFVIVQALENVYYSPATGVYNCPNHASLLLFNYRAAQEGGCRVAAVQGTFRVAPPDAVGSVFWENRVPNGTVAIACQNDTETALRVDDDCTCRPINDDSGEGCVRTTQQGFHTLPDDGRHTPVLRASWPDAAKPWTTTYAPATGRYACSAVPGGDVCRINMAATWMCQVSIRGFAYQIDGAEKFLTLTSVRPRAELFVSCPPSEDSGSRYRAAVQCDASCTCEPLDEEYGRTYNNLGKGCQVSSTRGWWENGRLLGWQGILLVGIPLAYCLARYRRRFFDHYYRLLPHSPFRPLS